MIDPMIRVEVAYARPEKQRIIALQVPSGTTILQAVQQSGIVEEFPEIDLAVAKMGIYSKAVPKPSEQVLAEGDRVEIYRPLLIDPKQARLNRARKGAAEGDA